MGRGDMAARIQCPREKLEIEEGLVPPPVGASTHTECFRLFTPTIPLVLRVTDPLYSLTPMLQVRGCIVKSHQVPVASPGI